MGSQAGALLPPGGHRLMQLSGLGPSATQAVGVTPNHSLLPLPTPLWPAL